jgi:hypothetical protein
MKIYSIKNYFFFAENSLSTVFRLAPFFLSTNLPLERGTLFIGEFELAPLRDWIRAMTRGHVFRPSAHGEVHTPSGPSEQKCFFLD